MADERFPGRIRYYRPTSAAQTPACALPPFPRTPIRFVEGLVVGRRSTARFAIRLQRRATPDDLVAPMRPQWDVLDLLKTLPRLPLSLGPASLGLEMIRFDEPA